MESSSPVDSDSEFELSMDDSGGLALEGSSETEAPAEGEEKDIFETDFEVPSLDEESGPQAVEPEDSDTDLESSDFVQAADEEDAAEEESGSQVIALGDEGEADEGAATVARPPSARRAPAPEEDEEEAEDLFDTAAAGEEVGVEEEAVGRPAERRRAAPRGARREMVEWLIAVGVGFVVLAALAIFLWLSSR